MIVGRFVAKDRFNNKEKNIWRRQLVAIVTQAVPCDKTRSLMWFLLDSCVDYNGSNLVLSRLSLFLSQELSRSSCWCFSGRSLQPWPPDCVMLSPWKPGISANSRSSAHMRARVHTQIDSNTHTHTHNPTHDDPHVIHLSTLALNVQHYVRWHKHHLSNVCHPKLTVRYRCVNMFESSELVFVFCFQRSLVVVGV